ncbi:MAG: hypothetical protein JSS59_01300 [Proteobacteria bacterium]|nr:hypothetical protein [Pseudomonadota bacterium]
MNVSNLVLATAFVAANAAAAQPSAGLDSVSVRGERIVIACAAPFTPSFAAVAELIDSNNATLIHAERERVLHTVTRLCMRGVGYVAFVRDEDSTSPALAQVQP